MYAVSFMTLTGQYVIGDVLGITLKNANGVAIRSEVLNATNVNILNSVTASIANGDYTLVDVASAFVKAGNVLVELLTLLTGTYIFKVLLLLGIPDIAIGGMIILYVILLGRTIIALIRGI